MLKRTVLKMKCGQDEKHLYFGKQNDFDIWSDIQSNDNCRKCEPEKIPFWEVATVFAVAGWITVLMKYLGWIS